MVPRRVMLVDDDKAVRRLVGCHLRLPAFELHAFAGASEGRFSSVELGGERVQVLTEVQPGPQFVMVTVVTRRGRGVCRIETVWRNPLRRAEDDPLAARQLDFEHERTLQSLAGLVTEGSPRGQIWSAAPAARSR